MVTASIVSERIEALEQAVALRALAWADEETAWGQFRDTLEEQNPLTVIRKFLVAIATAENLRHSFADALDQLVQTRGDLISRVEEVSRRLREITHDPSKVDWAAEFKTFETDVTSADDTLETSVQPFNEKLGHMAISVIADAHLAMNSALKTYLEAFPGMIQNCSQATAALDFAVSRTTNNIAADLRVSSDAVYGRAAMSVTMIDQRRLAYASALAQDVANFQFRIRETIRTITFIGNELSSLRTTLDKSVGEAGAPLADIKFILQDLLQRFRSI